ncbi:MAG: hypothetical protein COV07_02515 [Candidatus Vogelbacteria bacterium CG10_big_fil_rev_8_21_14_0_10_45_14]|uniref:Uncharacterized protein n=1 Tax=Candidatus Vogelbacteria bacterium CG10_big_fil_rev_8_21_14_0_10_45_14 TaxID=1975042 RepID=A0A2H0RJS6_9BACT|nr:MAG: hypothetical protein COV07_02515 [Candidatus Vogelbacteria bacterium CG10_big_fil_rev_8_21_14_0_10_45_14]
MAIVGALVKEGWTRVDVDEAFAILDTSPPPPKGGAHIKPEFMNERADEDEDGVTIIEQKISQHPEGLRVMPRSPGDLNNSSTQKDSLVNIVNNEEEASLLVAKRDKDSKIQRRVNPLLRGFLNATLIITVLAILAFVVAVSLGYIPIAPILNFFL